MRKHRGMLHPDRKKLRALRRKAGFTVEELAAKAGIGERTLRGYEAGQDAAREGPLACVAKALGVAMSEIVLEAAPETARGTRLTRLVRAEGSKKKRRRALEITALDIQNVHTTPKVHAGRHFLAVGTLEDQEAISDEEARALGIEPMIGARFNVTKEIAAGQKLSVTVFTRTAEQTRAMQERMHGRVSVKIAVLVAEAKDAFRGFGSFASSKMVPLALVMEDS